MDWLSTLGVAAVVLPSLYVYTASVVSSRFPALRNKRICLLIAHPDDEAMFFAPAVMALARPETGNHVKILCLSSGNADGLGETRKKELAESGIILGLRNPDDVYVVDNPDFPDSMTATWDRAAISSLLCSAFAPGLARARTTDVPPTASIDVLVTFDAGGVSGHPNHISLYHGAKTFVETLVAGKPGWAPPVDLYTLSTVPLVRKYTAFLDVLLTLASWAVGANKSDKKRPGGLVFLNGLAGHGSIGTARTAMISAHRSQMVWFRYGWITMSRYMYINDLRLEKIRRL
ncbi:putative deacetylase LmbE-like domain-containing protein [Staphylotrichum tortipilum]|uniref:N-acetylglucosaminylphosphatidylinositol deacetylase n=1 Tax=Staphylotrichum tortipilum TaxID=2831512 RepID=A0AAN6RX82_9PEZI|nr:putative deacetylase LmbE-like domain-containing protein [Staphylotrichum longicolle]